jgi:hypothetical protein
VTDRSARRERRREAIRQKLQDSATPYLEPGETIKLWVLGMTGPIPSNGIEGLMNLVRWAAGTSRPAGVLLTDRAVHVARTGWLRSSVRKLYASYPLNANPPSLDFLQSSSTRGSITVSNNDTVYLPQVQLQPARELVRTVRGTKR